MQSNTGHQAVQIKTQQQVLKATDTCSSSGVVHDICIFVLKEPLRCPLWQSGYVDMNAACWLQAVPYICRPEMQQHYERLFAACESTVICLLWLCKPRGS